MCVCATNSCNLLTVLPKDALEGKFLSGFIACICTLFCVLRCVFLKFFLNLYCEFHHSFVITGGKRKTLDEISGLYKELSIRVFTQSAIKGTSSLVWSHAYYDTALWEQLLAEHLGDKILIKTTRDPNAPKVCRF